MHRAWTALLVAGAIVFASAPAAAQEEAATTTEQEMMQKWMEFATPGEPHQRLAEMVGEWDYEMTWWMAPDAPPETSTGTMTAEMSMDGRYLVENWTGTAMGQPFSGRSTMGYDNFRDEYVSTWIDNMGTGIMVSTGQYDPAQEALVTTGTFDDIMTGERDKTMRGVSKRLDENTLHVEMYVPGPDGQEFKTGEIHATRKP
ncbi:MAG TPA: DUF1579 domain-containing protein [Gemmatimonadota bacterium]|nr:DUF1579 domain-containing protein [Gemmatimonadota bacterium]